MVQIISSVIAASNVQTDGRFSVHEVHTDDSGNQHTIDYLADADTDQSAHLANDASFLAQSLTEQLINREIESNLNAIIQNGSLAQPVFLYSSVPQNGQSLVGAYRGSAGVATIMIGDFLSTQSDEFLIEGSGLSQAKIDGFRPVWAQNATTAAAIRNAEVV